MALSVHVPADIVAIAKVRVADPTKVRQYERIVLGLAKDIKRAARSGEVQLFNAAAKKLEAEWSNLTKAQQEKVIREVGLIVRQHYVAMESKTATKLASFGRQIMKGTRRVFKDKIDPNISASLTSKDRVFVSRVSKSRAWFVKNHGKVIDEAYREKAAGIISSGAEAGLSDKQVSKELARVLNNKAIQQSEAYYRVVANAAMNRSRTWASLQSYDEAGIRGYTYAATLDEVTTDQCRFLHGKEYIVRDGIALMEKTEQDALDKPEAVKDVTPWMTTIKDKKTGNKFLAFKRGNRTTRVAEIKRSAVGQRDQVGSYDQLRSDDQLKKDGFQFPPLHGN